MVASAVKLHRTSGRVLYASAQLASIKLCDMSAFFNCQLLSEVTQDSTYHSLCSTCRGALAGTRNSSMGASKEKYTGILSKAP